MDNHIVAAFKNAPNYLFGDRFKSVIDTKKGFVLNGTKPEDDEYWIRLAENIASEYGHYKHKMDHFHSWSIVDNFKLRELYKRLFIPTTMKFSNPLLPIEFYKIGSVKYDLENDKFKFNNGLCDDVPCIVFQAMFSVSFDVTFIIKRRVEVWEIKKHLVQGGRSCEVMELVDIFDYIRRESDNNYRWPIKMPIGIGTRSLGNTKFNGFKPSFTLSFKLPYEESDGLNP